MRPSFDGQRAEVGLAGLDAVEEATRNAVAPLIADDCSSIAFDTNLFIYVVGQA